MSHAELPPLPVESLFSVVSRRNSSLARRERWTAFGLAAAASFAVALAFVVAGAWPVLPYSALEIALLGVAFVWVERRAGEWERVTVAGDRVIVERAGRGRLDRREFNRWWLRVELDEARRASRSSCCATPARRWISDRRCRPRGASRWPGR